MSLVMQKNQGQSVTPKTQCLIQGVRIVSTGAYAPENEVLNDDLSKLGFDSDWILQRTGIRSRRHVLPGQATSDLAIEAARDCLKNAGVSAEEVDLILVATMTPDYFTPSTACIVQAALGCTAAAIDMNAACSGFLYALITGCQFIKSGSSCKALIIGAETMSIVADPEDKKTYPLFGDGAGAVLLEADPNPNQAEVSGVLGFRLASVGELGESLIVPGGGSRKPVSLEVVNNREQYLRMDGRTVFKWAVRLIPEVVQEMLDVTKLTIEEVDLLILHQANERIITAATDHLNIDPGKIFVNVDRYGNTSAASVPISIHEARLNGQIKDCGNILMVGFGAGLTWASCMFRW